mmetsp:Transcript_95828/g.206860  ORF Transcript_95828/g.206860 Transcript_95828/m.206860 type:complete len:309 (-) Transcript_95828:1-927(-)
MAATRPSHTLTYRHMDGLRCSRERSPRDLADHHQPLRQALQSGLLGREDPGFLQLRVLDEREEAPARRPPFALALQAGQRVDAGQRAAGLLAALGRQRPRAVGEAEPDGAVGLLEAEPDGAREEVLGVQLGRARAAVSVVAVAHVEGDPHRRSTALPGAPVARAAPGALGLAAGAVRAAEGPRGERPEGPEALLLEAQVERCWPSNLPPEPGAVRDLGHRALSLVLVLGPALGPALAPADLLQLLEVAVPARARPRARRALLLEEGVRHVGDLPTEARQGELHLTDGDGCHPGAECQRPGDVARSRRS